MILFEHRINSIEGLRKVPLDSGIEFDVRLYHGGLVTSHSPFEIGDPLADFLKEVHNRSLVVNIKEEGIEETVLGLLRENNLSNYFLLDVSFPYLIKYLRNGLSKFAIRVSEFEDFKTLEKVKVDWCWLDTFRENFDHCVEAIQLAKNVGTKICLVSPELHDPSRIKYVQKLQELLKSNKLEVDAVCTKRTDLWS